MIVLFPTLRLQRAMRSAEKPTQRKCDNNGRVWSILDGVAYDILKRGRCPSDAIGCTARSVFSLAIQILSRTLSLVYDALYLALRIASATTKALLDVAGHVPCRASHSMFVHSILLFGLTISKFAHR